MAHLQPYIFALLLTWFSCQTLVGQKKKKDDNVKLPGIVQIDPADLDVDLQSMSDQEFLSLQRRIFPQEKLHVMTDGELYLPGDTVWMRVWVQDGETLKDSNFGSEYVYVDLVDSRDLRQVVVKLKRREGKFYGYLELPKSIISGDYTLCAYTHYQHRTPEDFLFKKNIHVITRENIKSGYTARPLFEHRLAPASMLESSGTTTTKTTHNDTLMRYTFPAPARTWYAISVTDDMLSPIDTAVTLEASLPQIPDFFTLESVHNERKLYKSLAFPESNCFIAGKIQDFNPNKKESNDIPQITIFNNKTKQIYFTEINKFGEFIVNDVDLPEGSLITYSSFQKDGTRAYHIEPLFILTPDTIHHLPIGRSRYFVNRDKEMLKQMGIAANGLDPETALLHAMAQQNSVDSIRLLNEVVAYSKAERKEREMTNIVKSSFFVDDKYTRSATKTILFNRFPIEDNRAFVADVIAKLSNKGIEISHGVPYYRNAKGELIPARIVIDTKERPYHHNSDGSLAPHEALRIPHDLVYAIDYLDPPTAQSVAPSREYPDSPIIRIDLAKESELLSARFRYTVARYSLGYQPFMPFLNNRVRTDVVHTRYWNPAVNSGRDGQLTVDLPLPLNHHTTYTLRAEGVTPEGKPISIIHRIKM